MHSQIWHAAFQASVRTESPQVHNAARAIADETVGKAGACDPDFAEALRAKLAVAEERNRVLRGHVALWRNRAREARAHGDEVLQDENESLRESLRLEHDENDTLRMALQDERAKCAKLADTLSKGTPWPWAPCTPGDVTCSGSGDTTCNAGTP